MRKRANEYYGRAKGSATRKINGINNQIDVVKDKIFKMGLSERMETLLRNRIRLLAIFGVILSVILIFLMSSSSTYLITALLVGIIAFILDFIIEYAGISRNAWDYPTSYISFKKVPPEVPIVFFSWGVFATFLAYIFSFESASLIISTPFLVGLSQVQIVLLIISSFFLFQYFRGEIKSMVFGTLPLGIAAYLSVMEPWILVVSILPMYLDYYLEKHLVKYANIEYDKYGESVAMNVAITYFPATLIIFGIVALIMHFIS